MELINHTPFPHLLFRTGIDGNKFAAAAIVRITYDIKDGVATPSANQKWPLEPAPWTSDYGPMNGDFVFKRGGVDIMVFGSAVAPKSQPVKQMEVRLVIAGKLDREWKSGFFGPGISEPAFFTEMPLSIANAYGGYEEWDGLKFPYPNNPYGKGFIWEKANAIGRKLPNIENPFQLITNWNDRPEPVGTASAPMSEKKVRKAVEFDKNGKMIKFEPIFYNAAFPDLIVKDIQPGEELLVEGVKPSGVFKFKIPTQDLTARLTFDGRVDTRSFFIDQVGLEPNVDRAFITYRYAFNYYMKPLTERKIEIFS